jgi:hypothetical protein
MDVKKAFAERFFASHLPGVTHQTEGVEVLQKRIEEMHLHQ